MPRKDIGAIAAGLVERGLGDARRGVDNDPDFLLLQVRLHELGPAAVVRSVEDGDKGLECVGHDDGVGGGRAVW